MKAYSKLRITIQRLMFSFAPLRETNLTQRRKDAKEDEKWFCHALIILIALKAAFAATSGAYEFIRTADAFAGARRGARAAKRGAHVGACKKYGGAFAPAYQDA